jgi:hypothetical protein
VCGFKNQDNYLKLLSRNFTAGDIQGIQIDENCHLRSREFGLVGQKFEQRSLDIFGFSGLDIAVNNVEER